MTNTTKEVKPRTGDEYVPPFDPTVAQPPTEGSINAPVAQPHDEPPEVVDPEGKTKKAKGKVELGPDHHSQTVKTQSGEEIPNPSQINPAEGSINEPTPEHEPNHRAVPGDDKKAKK